MFYYNIVYTIMFVAHCLYYIIAIKFCLPAAGGMWIISVVD